MVLTRHRSKTKRVMFDKHMLIFHLNEIEVNVFYVKNVWILCKTYEIE